MSRRGIVEHLKRAGEARADELADALGITSSAVRQHLSGLTGEGLIAHREHRSGPGRPKHVYHLTPAAEALFPKTYGELATELLDYVEEADPDLVEKVFARRRERRIAGARARLADKSFPDRVAELTRILDEDGYLAGVEEMPDGSFRIVEHNCAVLAVAQRYGQACSSELEFIRAALPDAKIDRVAHMMAGAHVCAYEVRPFASKASRPSRSATARRGRRAPAARG